MSNESQPSPSSIFGSGIDFGAHISSWLDRPTAYIGTDDEVNSQGSKDEDDAPALAVTASWIANWGLLLIKGYCFYVTSSKAVAAAMADSVVDLFSQLILSTAETYINVHSPDYPVGRSRLEALSVLGCAGIMSMASVEVIQCKFFHLFLFSLIRHILMVFNSAQILVLIFSMD